MTEGRRDKAMDAQTRRESIYRALKEQRKIRVSEIIRMFGVSAVTINNDLNILESEGMIRKSFGYAEICDELSFIISPPVANFAEKKKIARAAAELIQNNSSIAVYSGTTCQVFAREIPQALALTAVTPSLPVAVELGRNPRIKPILLGGDYDSDNFATCGPIAVDQLEKYNLDTLFMSVNGLSAENGCTIDHHFEATINEALIRNAKMVVAMADHTKIGVARFIKISEISEIDIVVTDDKAPEGEIEKLRAQGVEILIA